MPDLLDNPWLGLALWGLSYLADYYLTLYSARLYRDGGQAHFAFEGSLELTPYYQRDIDALRRVSLRFIFALLGAALLIEIIWYLANGVAGVPALFEFAIGGMVLREAAVLLRHARNIALFRSIRSGRAPTGQVFYPRRLSLSLSAAELLSFAALFAALGLLLGSWFLAGGAFACAVTSFQHWRRARRA